MTSGGVISGTPTAGGTASFIVQVSDAQVPAHTATQALTLTIAPAALNITTASIPDGVIGAGYSSALNATGGFTPYSWVIAAGALPAGLSLSTSGVISGTPSAAGSSSFTVRLTDAQSGASTRSFSLLVAPAVLVITTASPLPSGQVGNSYSTTVGATGGTVPYVWSLASGALPAGLALTVGGVISGTPTASGSSTFTIQVGDSQLPQHFATQSFTLGVAPAAIVINTTSLPAGSAGTAYSATLAATGGLTPYTWSLASGSLPGGLSLTSGGVISGTPTAGGMASFILQVSDAQVPAHFATQALTLTVNPGTLSVSTTSLANGSVGAGYSATLAATGGTPPYAWSVIFGSLPAGLSLASTGQITGTPTTPGTASFTMQVTDSQGMPATASRALTLLVNPAALSVVTASLPNGAVGSGYSAPLGATGGVAPYSWSVSAGSLPAGLSLNGGSGVISGTPTSATPASFIVRVTDSQGVAATASRSLTLTVFGSASISWVAPTLNEDGSALVPGGYFIFYGTNAASLSNSQQVANPSAIGGIVNGLTTGTWYFQVTAYDGGGNQSIRTNAASVVIP